MDPTSPRGFRVSSLIVGGIGAVLAVGGTLVAIYVPGALAARHARMQALPSPGVAALTDTPPGREVLVDGRIARDQPVLFRNFVAFEMQEEQHRLSDDDPEKWEVRARQAPPLHIVLTGDDPTRVVNSGYGIWGATTVWRDESKALGTRYTGLVVGEAVVVHARTTAGGLEAIEVASGTCASYLAGIAAGVGVAWWLGLGIGGVGAILLVVATMRFVRAARRAAPFDVAGRTRGSSMKLTVAPPRYTPAASP
jgi:hypothetical protein